VPANEPTAMPNLTCKCPFPYDSGRRGDLVEGRRKEKAASEHLRQV